nr:dynein beta chain, ciliary [Parasteatoda tepidariorum]
MSTEPEDIRFNYIQTVSQQILNYALKCWKDIIWNEDIQAIIKDYLEGSEILTLFIYLDQDNSLKITLKLPQKSPIPAKICFFLKRNVIVSDTDYKRELSFGCIYDYPLQEYQYIFSRVLSPIFCNAVNNEKWPAETFQDMYEHFEDFQMTLSYHIGICQERTILLIPETAKMIDSYNIDELSERSTYDLQLQKTLISITEMLSSWFLIVRQVLETTSESVLKKIDQGPLTEIYFWNERGKNLEFIFSQLNKPIVKKMVLALEKTKSCHYPKFKILLREVAEGLDEAKDISESFDHVTAKVNELEESSLQELKSLLPETMKSITSSWIGSKYYNRVPSRVTVLLKKCCIFISDKINTFLDAKTLFKIDRQEAKGNLKLSIDVTNVFLEAYEECREKFRDIYENELYPWDFPDERVFSQFKLFLLRLDNIHDILLSADVYFNIPHYKLASIHHKTYDRRLLELYSAFCSSYAVFENCSYNPLDIQSMDFTKDFEHFTGIVLELDHKLGIIIGQACLDCIPPEDGFKLIDLLQGLMKRPVVEMEFKKLIPSHMENIYEDLIAAQKSYSGLESKFNESSEVFVYKNLPKISGILQWSNDLFSKITLSVQMLEKKQEYFPTPEMYDFVIKAYLELQDLLEGLRQKVISHWEETLNILKVKLNDVVFVKDDADVTRLNFKPEIHEMTKEIEFLKHIEKANLMPDHEFDWVTKEFKLSQSLLANCISWYTDLNENLLEQEKQLVIQQWSEIKSFIEEGLSINWTRVDILKFAENMYNVTKKVFENVHLSKLNISEVEKFISTWNTTPMFTRASPDSLVDFEIYMNEEVRNKKDSAKKSTEMMQSVMEKNKNIFEADAHSTEWNDYIHYLDSIIEEGLKTVVKSSLQYLNDNTDSSNQKLACNNLVHKYF